MGYYIYIMCNSRKAGIYSGYCRDIIKAVKFFKEMPTMFFPPEKQNILIHLETADNENDAIERFKEISNMNAVQRNQLIVDQNENWVEIIPGVHFTI